MVKTQDTLNVGNDVKSKDVIIKEDEWIKTQFFFSVDVSNINYNA